VTAHTKFGTAKWFLPEGLRTDHDVLDLISARSEIYSQPAVLPVVKMGSIEDDLRRRDFSINALALRLDGSHVGELRDDLGGMQDLQQGVIRILHARSFIDDPTRMYRAVRYEARYGFQIAAETLALIPEARRYVENLSAQRIRHELDLILDEPHAVSMLRRLDDDPALQNRTSRWVLWLMHLTDQEIEFVHQRLHFNADLLKTLRSTCLLTANQAALLGLKPSKAVELLESYSFKALEIVSKTANDEEIRSILTRYIGEWRHVKPRTTGHDLKKLGIAPGPRYAEILRRLRAAWLDGEVTTAEEEKKLLQKLYS
jgi:tRNA nucleotidyltransferase (CCA-adding enzyme)